MKNSSARVWLMTRDSLGQDSSPRISTPFRELKTGSSVDSEENDGILPLNNTFFKSLKGFGKREFISIDLSNSSLSIHDLQEERKDFNSNSSLFDGSKPLNNNIHSNHSSDKDATEKDTTNPLKDLTIRNSFAKEGFAKSTRPWPGSFFKGLHFPTNKESKVKKDSSLEESHQGSQDSKDPEVVDPSEKDVPLLDAFSLNFKLRSASPSSAYKRLCHWFGSILRNRVKPSDVILVRGMDQPLLRDEEMEEEEEEEEKL
ncbi:uncharacterized protein LOC135212375 [Macrobrachium nipponense]|uniref:uncharacterized protein LOC135212375 n=1 Tax=Macrobrachium nipponense TaxID=159736 RepID=UPI0030C8086F